MKIEKLSEIKSCCSNNKLEISDYILYVFYIFLFLSVIHGSISFAMYFIPDETTSDFPYFRLYMILSIIVSVLLYKKDYDEYKIKNELKNKYIKKYNKKNIEERNFKKIMLYLIEDLEKRNIINFSKKSHSKISKKEFKKLVKKRMKKEKSIKEQKKEILKGL